MQIAINPSEARAVPTVAWRRTLDRFRNQGAGGRRATKGAN